MVPPMRIEELWISAALIVSVIGFAILSVAFSGGAPWSSRMPDLTPIPLFFLVLRQPTAIPVLLVFVLGLAVDLLYGRLVGTGALTFLVLFELLRWQANGRPVPPLHLEFAGFAIFTVIHTALITLIGVFMLAGTTAWNEISWQIAGSLILYPLCSLLMHGLFRIPSQTTVR